MGKMILEIFAAPTEPQEKSEDKEESKEKRDDERPTRVMPHKFMLVRFIASLSRVYPHLLSLFDIEQKGNFHTFV